MPATLQGTSSDDTLTSTAYDDVLRGEEGNDLLVGGRSLYGGDGNDTLDSGDGSLALNNGINPDIRLEGGSGDDTYIISTEFSARGQAIYVTIYDTDGVDSLDISSLATSIDNIQFAGQRTDSNLDILLFDDEGTYRGSITIQGHFPYRGEVGDQSEWQIEKLILGDQTIDITGLLNAGYLSSTVLLGADEGNNLLVGSEYQRDIYGLGGDDTIIAAESYNELWGDDGNDRLDSGGYSGVWLHGGDGADTYVINWDPAVDDISGYDFTTHVRDMADSDGDIIDLSAVVSSFNFIELEIGSNHLLVHVYEEGGGYIGYVNINNQISNVQRIESLVVGNVTLVLPDSNSIDLHNELLEIAASETLFGSDNADAISAYKGNDWLDGRGGDDRLRGGTGEDTLIGGSGDDTLTGGEGQDIARGGDDDDRIWAGAGDISGDLFFGDDGADTIGGGEGNDTLVGDGSSREAPLGGADILFGGAGDDIIVTGGWDDTTGNKDGGFDLDELIDVPNAADQAFSGTGSDTIYGSRGNEILGGGHNADSIYAGRGNDLIFGGGDIADDHLYGEAGDDTIFGGRGEDSIFGGEGDDVLYNGQGYDTVFGGDGNDTLWAGPGDDILNGGNGADVFAFGDLIGHDFISDFDLTNDVLANLGMDAAQIVENARYTVREGQYGVLVALGSDNSLFLAGLTLDDIYNITLQD